MLRSQFYLILPSKLSEKFNLSFVFNQYLKNEEFKNAFHKIVEKVAGEVKAKINVKMGTVEGIEGFGKPRGPLDKFMRNFERSLERKKLEKR